MYGWSHSESQKAGQTATAEAKLQRMRVFYESTEVFIVDEVCAMSAQDLGLMDETMCVIFTPDKVNNVNRKPFGGKRCMFLGDGAQLRPVIGTAIYDTKKTAAVNTGRGRFRKFQNSRSVALTARGHFLYENHLAKSCVLLQRGFRNTGLLDEILGRLRKGEQTSENLDRLMYQNSKFPLALVDRGVHFKNEACSLHDYQDTWRTCQLTGRRLFISRASYHMTADNDKVVSHLSAIEASQYKFAQDALCLAVGSEVRLVKNLNVSVDLVNSATGCIICCVQQCRRGSCLARRKPAALLRGSPL